MSKLAVKDRFFDYSDYGRPIAVAIAIRLKNTRFTPIDVTYMFGISGLLATYCILTDHFLLAAVFLILKSILDAADGELSRIKNTPSHSGRYLDSIFDFILNAMFLTAIGFITDASYLLVILAFISIQMQGTLYNYYYVILRNKTKGGDQTSKVFEKKSPTALYGESQKNVDMLFRIFYFFYGVFDHLIYRLDRDAYKAKAMPSWFMTLVSLFGLGFQLFIMAVFLVLDLADFIIPFFLYYNLLFICIVGIRKSFLSDYNF